MLRVGGGSSQQLPAAVPATAPAAWAMAGDTRAPGGGLLPCRSLTLALIWLFPTLSVYFFIYL